MRIYLSSPSRWLLDTFATRWPDRKLDVLRSFAVDVEETKDIAVHRPDSIRSLILDSGAWSLNTKPELKEQFKVQHYKEFLWNYGEYFEFYFNSDIDFSEHGEIANWELLKFLEQPFDNALTNSGLSPVPVIQNLQDVDKYIKLKDKYPLVAIGSGAK